MDRENRAVATSFKTIIYKSQSFSYLANDKISKKDKKIRPSRSCVYNSKLTPPKKDTSYLISNNSKLISEGVSYIPVLDRLTCDYLVPEAHNVLRKTKSLSCFPTENKPVQDLQFESTMLSAILPNTVSYMDLTTFMKSPQHRIRRRGQTPSFEKALQLYINIPQRKYHGPFDLEEFYRRDQELIHKKDQLANHPPPKIKKLSNNYSQKLAKQAEMKSPQSVNSKKGINSPKRESSVTPKKQQSPKKRPTYRLSATTEVMANIKLLQHEINRIENENDMRKKDKEISKQKHYMSPQIKKRANKAQARREEEGPKANLETTPKKETPKPFYHKVPGYMSDVSAFISKQKKRERYDKLPDPKPSPIASPKKA